MKKCGYILIIILLFTNITFSQEIDKKNAIEKCLFHERVFKKVFFDHSWYDTFPFEPIKGKVTFIIPDTTFRSGFPGILDEVYGSFAAEKRMLTLTWIKREKGTVFISSNVMLPGKELWVKFDKMNFFPTKADIHFHLVSISGFNTNVMHKYYKFGAILKKIQGQWKVQKIKIRRTPAMVRINTSNYD